MIILAYGVPGAGKSTWLHDLVNLWADHQLFYVVDHTGEWAQANAPHWRGRAPPLHVVSAGQQPPADLEVGVVVFQGWEARDVAQAAIDRGWCTFVDDEIDIAGRRKGFEDSPLRRIVHQGRHIPNARGEFTECHILGACRRPTNLHTDLSELADEVWIFRLQGLNTIQRLLADHHIAEGEEERVLSAPNFRCRHFPSGNWWDVDPL